MIFTFYGLIIFMQEIWIGVHKETREKESVTRAGFAIPAIPTRHTIPSKPIGESQYANRVKALGSSLLAKINNSIVTKCISLKALICIIRAFGTFSLVRQSNRLISGVSLVQIQ